MNPLAPLLAQWYTREARDLPWRHEDVSPWGILVSEIMLQQTPGARVIPYWTTWMERWPTPHDLAAATPAEVIQAWGTLGYPRRGLRLRECAQNLVSQGGIVPCDEITLRQFPGIGEYTAAAVAAFAYGQRTVVLDTNIRRVIARTVDGQALPSPTLTNSERHLAASLLPDDAAESVRWNQATMELGATLCAARGAHCEPCPVKDLCAWRAAGHPGDLHAGKRRPQGYEGTNRQARGRVLAILREADGELVPIEAILATLPRRNQAERAVESLVTDGLAEQIGGALRLPAQG